MMKHTLIPSDDLSNEVRCLCCGFVGTAMQALTVECNDAIDVASGTVITQDNKFQYTLNLDEEEETELTSM